MKRFLAALLCTAMLLSVGGVAFAEEANPNLTETSYTLELNGTPKDLGGLKIMSYNGIVMVPLRLISEALGFSVLWFGDTQSIRLDNDTYSTNLIMNADYYYSILDKTKAMTTPVNLGIGPMLINGSTYVPADFFGVLYRDKSASQTTDNVVRIKAVKPAESGTVMFSTTAELILKLGYPIAVPSYLPAGYQIRAVCLINNIIAQIYYSSPSGGVITYRTAYMGGDISSDPTPYTSVSTITVGTTEVVVKGMGSGILLAVWSKGVMSYSLAFTVPVSEADLRLIIAGIA